MEYCSFSSSTEDPSSNYPLAASSSGGGKDQEKQQQKGGGGSSGRRLIRGNKFGVKLSTDAQSVAARERRHRISQRFKILQSLVPGGTKMDTVSMLEEAIHYVKFLKTQIWLHHTMIITTTSSTSTSTSLNPALNLLMQQQQPPPVDDPHSYALLPVMNSNVVALSGDQDDHQAQGFAAPPLLQPGSAHFGPEFEQNINTPLDDAITLLY